jgi:hypothetical protein
VHLTSAAVNGLPSCHLTPCRNVKVRSVPSSFNDQLVARSGTIDERLTWGTCWSNMTRLLNTPITGLWATAVLSSSSDMLAGLAGLSILRTPPRFWATAGSLLDSAMSNALATAAARNLAVIPFYLPSSHRRGWRYLSSQTSSMR